QLGHVPGLGWSCRRWRMYQPMPVGRAISANGAQSGTWMSWKPVEDGSQKNHQDMPREVSRVVQWTLTPLVAGKARGAASHQTQPDWRPTCSLPRRPTQVHVVRQKRLRAQARTRAAL